MQNVNVIDKSVDFFKQSVDKIQTSDFGSAVIEYWGIPTTYEDLFTVGMSFVIFSLLSYIIIRIITKMVNVFRFYWKFSFSTEGHYDINEVPIEVPIKQQSTKLTDEEIFKNETRFYRGRIRYYIEKYNNTNKIDTDSRYIYIDLTEEFLNFVFQKTGKPQYRMYLDYMERKKIIHTYHIDNKIITTKDILIK